MGMWGTAPWANDSAADFFADALDGVAGHIEHALTAADDIGFDETTYGAVWLLSVIGKVYVYDINLLEIHRARAKELVRTSGQQFVARLSEPYSSAVWEELQVILIRLDAEDGNGAHDAFERIAQG